MYLRGQRVRKELAHHVFRTTKSAAEKCMQAAFSHQDVQRDTMCSASTDLSLHLKVGKVRGKTPKKKKFTFNMSDKAFSETF